MICYATLNNFYCVLSVKFLYVITIRFEYMSCA